MIERMERKDFREIKMKCRGNVEGIKAGVPPP